MREIRYRAWNKHHKKMYDVYATHFNEGLVMCKSSAGTTHTFGMIDLELMQYTGLKDVYQSDIVSDHVGIGVVEYVDDCAAFRVNYRNGSAKWFYDYILCGELESIEVIGNIHESPELMDKQN